MTGTEIGRSCRAWTGSGGGRLSGRWIESGSETGIAIGMSVLTSTESGVIAFSSTTASLETAWLRRLLWDCLIETCCQACRYVSIILGARHWFRERQHDPLLHCCRRRPPSGVLMAALRGPCRRRAKRWGWPWFALCCLLSCLYLTATGAAGDGVVIK